MLQLENANVRGIGWVVGGLLIGAPLAVALAAENAAPQPAVSREAAAFFESKVRPVLVARCFACHSAASKPVQGGLKLDTREGLLAGGVRGPSLVPGEPEKSSLIRVINGAEKDLRMPPAGKQLSAAEVAALTAWVKMGAPWPTGTPPLTKWGPGGVSRKTHWAYVPPRLSPLPKVKNAAWVRNPVDAFILAGLEAKGLVPAPPADRLTLLRRATFDLTGLPPTPEEIAQFEQECGREQGALSPNTQHPAPHTGVPQKAYAALIDRLLASPAYGERWGRHWLDVARYADSNGLDENLVYANAWRYRDYVIRAFNADKPVDRFIQEQLAGDLLGGDDAHDGLVATGFLSIGPKMLAEDDPVKQEEDIIDEQVDTLGKAFMGMTLGCARCHDHKFDPFPQTDYYALAGIFKSTRTMQNFRVVAEWQEVPLVSAEVRAQIAVVEKQVAEKQAAQKQRRGTAGNVLLSAARASAGAYLDAAREQLRASASGMVLKPVLTVRGAPLPSGALLFEAEDFTRGNVLKDRQGYGAGIGVLVNAGQYPNFTEYEFTVPQAGPYQLDLRYASGDPRAVQLHVNGALVTSTAAGRVTGGFFPDKQEWEAEGVFRLQAGKNVVRIERASYFPHIDQLLLAPYSGTSYPRTPEQLAVETGLVPDFVAQAAEQLKESPALTAAALKLELPEKPDRLFSPALQAELKAGDDEIAALEKTKPVAPRAMAVSEGKPANLKVHLRGDYQQLGKECPRQFPVILAGDRQPPIDDTRSGRLELARWLTRPDHPLTSRVFVNRVWRWHFGQGIVPSTDNFGILGEKPTNQPLLDWLASEFAQPRTPNTQHPTPTTPWSLKSLHRLLMLSNSYQMSSRYDARAAAVDPGNQLHWRSDRRRLEAEAIRDSILSISGQLDRTMGGSLLNFKDREYVTSTANADPVKYTAKRRSVYLPVIRSALYDVFTAFDFGDPSVLNGDRATTTVAPQALFMMNSPLVLEETRAMAARLLALPAVPDEERIRVAYQSSYGRPPTPAESRRATAFLSRVSAAYETVEKDPEKRRLRAWQSLCKGLVSANEFVYVD